MKVRRAPCWSWGRIGQIFVGGAFMLFASCCWVDATEPWPGETKANSTSLRAQLSGEDGEVGGLFWNPTKRELWVLNNNNEIAGGGGLKILGIEPDGAGGWRQVKRGGSDVIFGTPGDPEDLTQADLSTDVIYVLDEASGTVIRQYTLNGTGGASNTRNWALNAIPAMDGSTGAGSEGIAFVPDAWLSASGFVDSAGNPRPSQKGMGGLMFVAHQNGGFVFVLDLNPANGSDFALVGKYQTGRTESSALAFDRSTGRLHISHNISTNFVEVTDLRSTATATPGVRKFMTLVECHAPESGNLEGFAIQDAEQSTEKWAFWCTDGIQADALRWYDDFKVDRALLHHLEIAQGNAQSGGPDSVLPIPVVAKAVSPNNERLRAITLDAAVTVGGGSIASSTGVTDGNGLVTFGLWKTGILPGSQVLNITSRSLPAISVNATALVPDTDTDGIPDAWETAHGLAPGSAADGPLDLDGDGFSNLEEYYAGTDPRVRMSALEIASMEPVGTDYRIRFWTVQGREYVVERKADLRDVNWGTLGTVTGNGGVLEIVDPGGAAFDWRFYRLRLIIGD